MERVAADVALCLLSKGLSAQHSLCMMHARAQLSVSTAELQARVHVLEGIATCSKITVSLQAARNRGPHLAIVDGAPVRYSCVAQKLRQHSATQLQLPMPAGTVQPAMRGACKLCGACRLSTGTAQGSWWAEGACVCGHQALRVHYSRAFALPVKHTWEFKMSPVPAVLKTAPPLAVALLLCAQASAR